VIRRIDIGLLQAMLVVTLAGCDTSAVESQARLAEAIQLANANDYVTAARTLEAALLLDPNNAQAHYTLGLIRLQRFGDPSRSIDSLETAARLRPDDAEVRYQIGVAYAALDRQDDAVARYEEAIGLDPAHAGALYRLGVAKDDQGEVRAAIDLYTRSIHADPYFPLPYNGLANIYVTYGRPQEAIQVLQNAIENCVYDAPEFEAGNVANRADLGRVYLEVGELDLAIHYLEAAESLSGGSSAVSFNLGVAFRRRFEQSGDASDRRAAQAQLERARARCNPGEEPARCTSIAAALSELRAQERAQ